MISVKVNHRFLKNFVMNYRSRLDMFFCTSGKETVFPLCKNFNRGKAAGENQTQPINFRCESYFKEVWTKKLSHHTQAKRYNAAPRTGAQSHKVRFSLHRLCAPVVSGISSYFWRAGDFKGAQTATKLPPYAMGV
jgi:hypothetical protein